MKYFKSKKGAITVDSVIDTIVIVIVIVAAAIPVVDSVIASSNLTGTTAVIVALIPVFLALAGLVAATKLLKT